MTASRGTATRATRSGGVSCCSDIGALCNRSDVVTDARCLARFRQVSPAARTCARPRAIAAISGENYNCTISAECWMTVPPPEFYPYMPTKITVPWLDLGDVRNCSGRLTRGPCGGVRTAAPTVSASDARAAEARGASLDFTVRLSLALSETVTVGYATSDGTATAGSDYRATSGTLTFSAGQTSQRVSVPVLDDDLDEGSETLTLTLSNPSLSRVRLADATATGTISNTDRMPKGVDRAVRAHGPRGRSEGEGCGVCKSYVLTLSASPERLLRAIEGMQENPAKMWLSTRMTLRYQ